MQNAKRAESMSEHAFSQFELTSKLLRNLYNYDLTPVTKLVLLELTTHLNESKNGSVVFPSVGYIAEVLGIGLTAAKKAINDLIKEGLIIKSKRDKVRGNCNKYLLTLKVRNLTDKPSENEHLKRSECDLFMITNNKEQKKEQTLSSGENVYTGDDKILADYAVKHKAKSVSAYIAKLKETKSAEKIICEYKKRKNATQNALRSYQETQETIKLYKSFKTDAVAPETSLAWQELGKKFGIKK